MSVVKRGPTHPSTRTLRDEAAQRRLCQTLGVMSTHSSLRSAVTNSERPDWKPNSVSRVERTFNLVLAGLLVAYGLAGIVQGQFKVSPPRSGIGLVLQGPPAWLFASALFTGAAVLLSVVLDHYDRRANEHWYLLFKRAAVSIGLCLVLAALVSGFFVALVGK
jgi:hypothetical protein